MKKIIITFLFLIIHDIVDFSPNTKSFKDFPIAKSPFFNITSEIIILEFSKVKELTISEIETIFLIVSPIIWVDDITISIPNLLKISTFLGFNTEHKTFSTWNSFLAIRQDT